MSNEAVVFKNALVCAVNNLKVSYKEETRREKTIVLVLDKDGNKARVIISRLKGKKHFNKSLVSQNARLTVEAAAAEHLGEEKLWTANRILILNQAGETVAVFT